MLENIIVLIAVRATVIGAHVPEAVITALRSICAGMMCAFQATCGVAECSTHCPSLICAASCCL